AKRYNRIAFPDSFNKGLGKKGKEKIEKTLRKHSEKNKGLFLNLSFAELPEGGVYEIALYMLLEDDVLPENLGLFQTALEEIINIIEKNETIKVKMEEHGVRTLSEITAAEYLNLYKWDFDYLSHY